MNVAPNSAADRGPHDDADAAAPPTVLVVDDSPLDRRLAGSLLEKSGEFRVEFAADGREALQAIAARAPDVVLTDMQMPELDGLQLVESLRARHAQVPAILMTAHGSEITALQALQRGAASYVPKRNLARDLVNTVRDVLAVARTKSERQNLLHACWSQTEFEFRLDNDDALIPVLVGHLQHYSTLIAAADETESVRVGVALHEALRNAMHHGNLELDSALRNASSNDYYELAARRRGEEPYRERRVNVRVRQTPAEVAYVIRDDGPGFDPGACYQDPTDPANLEKPSGRGLFLIRMFMNEVRFNDRGNEITMIRRRASRADGAAAAQAPSSL